MLFLGAHRSRDRVLRRHIMLFVGFCGALFLYLVLFVVEGVVASTINSDIFSSYIGYVFPTAPFLLGAYLLYRSARSLAAYTSSLDGSETREATIRM